MSEREVLGPPVLVRLPELLRKRVDALADATRRSGGDVSREALECEVDQLERERVSERAAAVRAGRVPVVTLAELNAELGDLGPVDMNILDEIE